jgi:sacsin
LGIFKEFIQNADDAEADEIVFVIDEMQFSVTGLPESMHWLHTTPSLLVYNNKSFSENDIQGIQSIGASGKSKSVGKTGRFGLGFNACYNITDVPCFFTDGNLYFFDPHFKTIPHASSDYPGRSFSVVELQNEGWPLLDSIRKFVIDENAFGGTVFRLPFRTVQQAGTSKIKKDVYTVEDALQCVNELEMIGSAILIFLKHVKSLRVEHRLADGTAIELLSIEAVNKNEIIESRLHINDFLNSADSECILTELSTKQQIYSSCLHKYRVLNKGAETTDTWRIIDGFFADSNNEVISSCRQMIQNEEKALPYAGAAWKLNSNSQTTGRIFCFLPVPIQTSLPIHINGYFDLDDSRQSMFLDSSSHGSAGIRVKWNKVLLENSVALAYERLLEDLKLDLGVEKMDSFYSAFPRVVENETSWEAWIISAFYKYSSHAELIKVSGNTIWSSVTAARFLPKDLAPVGDVLITENFLPIPHPPLPEYIRYGFVKNGIKLSDIAPRDLRIQLNVQKDVDCPINAAPRECLRKREYIEQILRFCLSDAPVIGVHGLPLINDCRGHLRTLGLTKYPLYMTEYQKDMEVFCNHPELFVDAGICLILNFKEQKDLLLYNMNSAHFIQMLSNYVNAYGKDIGLKMRTGVDGVFTDEWLQAVFKRLLDYDLNKFKDDIKKIPLVPDQSLVLQEMGYSSTPLLFRGHNENLKSALSELSVPLVKGVSDQLFNLLLEFSKKNNLIWEVTPRDLIDTLEDQCIDILKEYDQITNVQRAILDYLSKDDNLIKISGLQDRKDKLKTLKIFPTSKGRLVDLCETAYISQNFSFPSIDVNVTLLDCGESNQWHKLYSMLGIQELSRSCLILDWILPDFEKLDVTARINASIWLRDNLSIAQSESEAEGSNELFIEVRNSPFIVCDDGELRAPMNVYQPNSKLARDILGDQASFPDMDSTYVKGKERWLGFFRQMDMATEPRLRDVLKYIRKITTDSIYGKKIECFQSVYEYIKERVDAELQKNKVVSEELAETLAELTDIAWIPIRQDADNFICFKPAECTLARPGDVFFARFGQLVASQAYITALRSAPNKRTRKAMGFPIKPSIEMVAEHFKEVLDSYASGETMPDESELVKALSQIYRFFGGEAPREENEIEDDTEENETEYNFELKATFSEIDCIWDQELKRFWRPNHVFVENVKYMQPWRRTIKNSNNAIERGFDALGRKQKPTIEDWKQVLKEISENGELGLNNEVSDVVREVIRQIVMELDNSNDADGSVLVPTRGGSMISAENVFIADAPWYESILDSFNIPILSQSVSDIRGIHRVLKIPSLAESIKEKLSKLSDVSVQEDVKVECLRLEALVQSKDFILGLQRLLQNEDYEIFEESLANLNEIKVRGVKKINTCLYLYFNGTQRFIGDSEADFYLDDETFEAMLVESRHRYFCNDLAEIINRTLRDKLKNLAPLVQILHCKPSEISEVLDDLKIRKYSYYFEEKPEEDTEITPQEFPYEDNEVDASYTHEGIDDINYSTLNNNESIEVTDYEKGEVEENTDYSQQDDRSELSHEIVSGTSSSESRNKQSSAKSLGGINKGNMPHQYSGDNLAINLSHKTSSYVDLEQGGSPITEDGSFTQSTASSSHNKSQRRLLSYVVYGKECGSGDMLSDGNGYKLDIAKAAVDIVIEYEKGNGRNASSMAHSNAGYDVLSESVNEVRYIEVKGTEAAWGERGVTLSSTQFFYSKEYPDRDYWLYVVENVFSKTPLIHKIHNPREMVNYFVFDGGWSQVAESIEWKGVQIKEPTPGDEVHLNGSLIGIVELIQRTGKFQLVHYRALDGTLQKKLTNNLVFRSKEVS